MSETYLNGKLNITSLAVPTDEDISKIRALSADEHKAMLTEALEVAANSGISEKTADEIFEAAVRKAKELQAEQEHAL